MARISRAISSPTLVLAIGLAMAGILPLAPAADAGILDATWTAPTTNADGTPLTDLASYRVYFGTSTPVCPGASIQQVPAPSPAPTAGTPVNYRITGLQTGTTYSVAVTAVDTGGSESACSNTASAVASIDFSVTPTTTVDFGTVAIGSSANMTFTVQNTGGGTVSGSVMTSAPFSIVSGSPFNLVGAGASQIVTVRFTPTVSGTAVGNVNFVASGGTISRAVTGTGSAPTPLTITNLTANLASPQTPGTTITFTATATGGTAPYQYKWWVYNGTTWSVLQNWSTSNTFAWTPVTANANYKIEVWVRSAGSTVDTWSAPNTYGDISFAIQAGPPLTLTSLTANLTAPQPPGTTITFTATATGGTAPYQYKWWVYNGAWSMVQNWSTSNTFAWTPTTPNANYRIEVWIRSAGSTVDSYTEAYGDISFAVGP